MQTVVEDVLCLPNSQLTDEAQNTEFVRQQTTIFVRRTEIEYTMY